MKAEDLQARLDKMLARIETALAAVHNGGIPALGDLEMQAARLCVDVRKAEPAEARAVQPAMGEMISRLDELAEGLAALKKEK